MRTTLTVLAFHRILPKQKPFRRNEMHGQRFDRLIRVLKKQFLILPLSEAVRYFCKTGRPNILAITFDDGYRDNFEVALPILLNHGIKATFFVSSGFLDGGWMWNDGIIKGIQDSKNTRWDLSDLKIQVPPFNTFEEKRIAIGQILVQVKYRPLQERIIIAKAILKRSGVNMPSDLMMDSEQVRKLHAFGMEVGGHTVNHPILKGLDSNTARYEIAENKRYLEELSGSELESFAFPNGIPGVDYDRNSISILKSVGYKYAVTTESDLFTKGMDPFQIPRFSPWDQNPLKYSLRIWFKKLVCFI